MNRTIHTYTMSCPHLCYTVMSIVVYCVTPIHMHALTRMHPPSHAPTPVLCTHKFPSLPLSTHTWQCRCKILWFCGPRAHSWCSSNAGKCGRGWQCPGGGEGKQSLQVVRDSTLTCLARVELAASRGALSVTHVNNLVPLVHLLFTTVAVTLTFFTSK